MSYFPADSQLLRTGARFNRYYWRHCVALPHGSIRALWNWLDAKRPLGTQQRPELQSDLRCGTKPPGLQTNRGHAVKVGASEAPFAAGPCETSANHFAEPRF